MNVHRYALSASALPLLLTALLAGQTRGQAAGSPPGDDGSMQAPRTALIEWSGHKALGVADADGNALGTLKDIVVDARTGLLSHAALASTVDGKTAVKALMFDKLRWETEPGRFRCTLSRDELAALPDFSQTWLKELAARGGRVIEAGHAKDSSEGEAAAAPMQRPYLLASEVEALELSAKDGVLGTPRSLVLSTDPGQVAYVLVPLAGDKSAELRPLPWGAIRRLPGAKLGVDKTLSEMSAAPSVSKERTANLALAKFREEIARFYGLPSPLDERSARPGSAQ